MRIEKNAHTRGKGQENEPKRVICSVREWEEFAGPKLKKQWKPGRSACELARAWMSTGTVAMPKGLSELFDTCDLTRGMTVEVIHPEERIWFDEFGGEPRNADLAFIGEAGGRKVAVNIEAKADESFGRTLTKAMEAADKKKAENSQSRRPERITNLLKALFGTVDSPSSELLPLRYQLLTAVAGTLAYATANNADLAVLVVHVFEPEGKVTTASARNTRDLAEFLAQLSRTSGSVLKGHDLEGPFSLPGGGRLKEHLPLLIGKVVTPI